MRKNIATLIAFPFMLVWFLVGVFMVLLSLLIDGIMGYSWSKEGI